LSGRYNFRVTWSEDDQEWVGLCAEFPSLSRLAISPEAALRGVRKIVADVVADMTNPALLVEVLSKSTEIVADMTAAGEEVPPPADSADSIHER
jgi:hypothetical protein